MIRVKSFLFKLIIPALATVFIFGVIDSGSFATDFVYINGPSVGVSNPTEGEDDGLYSEAGFMLAGIAEFILGRGPFFIRTSGGYGRGGYTKKHQNDTTEVNYDQFGVELTTSYCLKQGNSVSLYYGGRVSYDIAARKRSSDGMFPDWDEGGDPSYAVTTDDGNVGELSLTAGPALIFRPTARFLIFGYAGLGFARVHQTGTWVMKWYPPSTPREDKSSYDEAKSGVSFAGTVLSRSEVSRWFGIEGGVVITTFPKPESYAYIPESHFRHWGWPAVNVRLWVGPSFAL